MNAKSYLSKNYEFFTDICHKSIISVLFFCLPMFAQAYTDNNEGDSYTKKAVSLSDQRNAALICTSPLLAGAVGLDPQKTKIDPTTVVVVFARHLCDVNFGLVDYYEAVFVDGSVIHMDHNFLEFNLQEVGEGVSLSIRPIFVDGSPGNLSEFIDVTAKDFDEENINLNAMSFSALSCTICSTLYSPVMGSFITFGKDANTNSTDKAWSFWQHKSGNHKAIGGIGGADDTYSWDINLNIKNVASDLDAGMYFFPVKSGKVVPWYNDDSDQKNDILSTAGCRPVLIEHQDGTSKFWSGYLHAASLYVKEGDLVTTAMKIGKIGNTSCVSGATYPNHLHLAVYTGQNKKDASGKSLLKSVDIGFSKTPISFGVISSKVSLKVGDKIKLVTTATGIRYDSIGSCATPGTCTTKFSFDLNGATWYRQYYWTSSNSTVVSVDGYGFITGKSKGTATVSVYFSGEKYSFAVTVN